MKKQKECEAGFAVEELAEKELSSITFCCFIMKCNEMAPIFKFEIELLNDIKIKNMKTLY